MIRKEDSRAVRSKEKIKIAFRELLREKGFAKTTVSDIIRRAKVNRSTFYAHYVDKFDLLDQFEDEMFSKIAKASEKIPEYISKDGFMQGSGFKEYIASVLEILSENEALFAVIYDSRQSANFQKKLFAHLNAVWSVHHIQEDIKADAEYVQIAAVGMCCALIEKWIESGCTPDIPEFSHIVSGIAGSFAEGVLGTRR